jgi:hypothetical protein
LYKIKCVLPPTTETQRDLYKCLEEKLAAVLWALEIIAPSGKEVERQ